MGQQLPTLGFGPGGSIGQVVLLGFSPAGSGTPLLRDDRILIAARDLLAATGVFRQVECGLGPDDYVFPADDGLFVTLYFEDTADIDDGASGEDIDDLQTAYFIAQVTARNENPLVRLVRMKRAENVIRATLNGRSLGGGTFPALTRIRRARPVPNVKHPDSTSRLRGEWSYIVEGDAWDVSDLEAEWNQ